MADDIPFTPEEVARRMAALDEPEREVLRLRFLDESCRCRTIAEVCDLLGLSRDEVSAIEGSAMEKLRALDSG